MKKITLLFLAGTIAVLGTICVIQSRKVTGQRNQLNTLRTEAKAKEAQAATLAAAQKQADEQSRNLLQQADELAAQLQARRPAESNGAAAAEAIAALAGEGKSGKDKGGFGNMLAKMMQDPDTRKFIRDQQRMMMDQLYSPLVKQMGLTPEEATQFKDLLADNMIKGTEKATSLFGASATNRAAMAETLNAEQKSFDEQVKAFLGEERYAQYKAFEETVGERTQLNLYKQQFGGDNPLSDQQAEQLLAFMKEEKQSVATLTGQKFPGAGQDQAALQAMFSEEQTDKLLQAQEQVNQRVFERARGILTPEQLDSFGKFQTNQVQMMRMGLSMARKMFNSDGTEGAAAPPASGQ